MDSNKSPTLITITVILSCLIPLLMFSILNANAETKITTGTEYNEALVRNETLEDQPWTDWINITGYHRDDQCFLTPETDSIMSFAFAFLLPENGINSGSGVTLCYPSQLDKKNTSHGLVSNIQYRMPNIKRGNFVADTCERARLAQWAKCDEFPLVLDEDGAEIEGSKRSKCMAFANASWHGMNIVSDGPDKMNVTVSTSKETFVVDRKHFKDGRFYLKLTRHNDIMAVISKIIGPGFDPDGFTEYNHRLESINIVKTENNMDEKLREAFLANVGAGAPLRKYAGIWSLAADILPSIEGEIKLDFFVIRSECSDLAMTFLMPWDKEAKLLPHRESIGLKSDQERFTKLRLDGVTSIRGKVHDDAKSFSIELINTQMDSDFKGVRLMVKFKNGIGHITFEMLTEHDGKWTEIPQKTDDPDPIVFKKGEQFILKMKSRKDDFQMSLNCGPVKNYTRHHTIDYVNWLKFKIDGDVGMYYFSGSPELVNQFHEVFAFNFGVLQGYFLRVELSASKDFDIRLMKNNTNTYHPYLKISSKEHGNNIIFSVESNTEDKVIKYITVDSKKFEKSTVGKQLDIHIYRVKDQVNANGEEEEKQVFKVALNDTLFDKLITLDKNTQIVDTIQVDFVGDVFVEDEYPTNLAPKIFQLTNTTDPPKNPPTYVLKGRMTKFAENFVIDFLTVLKPELKPKIDEHLAEDSDVYSYLHIDMNLNTSIVNMGSSMIIEADNNQKDQLQFAPKSSFLAFEKGKDFEIKIEVSNVYLSKFDIFTTGSNNLTYSFNSPYHVWLPNWVQIKGEGVFLYGEPEMIVKESV